MQFPVTPDVPVLSYATQCLQNPKGRSFASIYIHGILSKFDSLKLLIENSGVDIFAVSESFLNDTITNAEINIEGYSTGRGDRDHRSGKLSGGGLVVYTSDAADVTPVPNGHFCSPNVECLWVCLKLTRARPVYVCNIYRPPDASVQNSLHDLEQQHGNLISQLMLMSCTLVMLILIFL